MTSHLDLDALVLKSGGHDSPENGLCIMEDRQRLIRRLAGFLRPVGECLEFTGTCDKRSGHGSIHVGSRTVKAHRLTWELLVGPIPEGLCVLHRCDNPPCCYIDHLFLGTVADNNADRAAKGRSRGTFPAGDAHPAKTRPGELHWLAKLTDADVRDIRARCGAGATQTSVAAEFGVNSATVSRIVRRVWRQEVA